MSFQWRKADVMAILTAIGGRGNIYARVQALQKLGYPATSRTGRGRAAFYSGEDILFIALVEELNKVGIGGGTAAEFLIREGWLAKWKQGDAIYRLSDATATHIVLDYGAISKAIWDYRQRTGRVDDAPRAKLRGRAAIGGAA